ncbi:MAG: circularly permuted type 2 ATP-grasp protein [Campylobacterales bacterium]|nr:circularly permuted type 2 ATP-grasp protein [Campylobacterales bacterium]
MSIFESYQSDSSFDEIYDADGNIKEYWKEILQSVESAGDALLKSKQEDIEWHIESNGVTFNSYESSKKSTNRYWSMDPIPFVIQEEEWDELTLGLQQRAKLLNLILKDLYSERKLIKENIIPAEVVFGHKGYAKEVYNLGSLENFSLQFYATDIARGPDGRFWVISDKTQAPSGLGYAIENRLTMNAISKEIYPDIQIKKLYPFIEDYKNQLKKLSGDDLSKAAILTPGVHNQTYFEHAYLSAHLQVNLVQGADLLSKNGSLWLKSLSGLKEINTLIRRVDDRYCDPLELKSSSQLGVAGAVDALRQGNLNMLNPIGSAILENAGLNPFMEKIAEYFLQEKLILPQIATWWCGQPKELAFVLENIQKFIIKKIDRTEKVEIYFVSKLSAEELESLKASLQNAPHQYVAQEEMHFSTVPYYKNELLEPRNAVIRTFSVKKDESYSVMKGGLVRVSASKDTLLLSSQQGGTSKDLWILSNQEEISYAYDFSIYSPYVETAIQNIPTLKAENLFWFGRYLARSIVTARLISHLIKRITNFYRYEIDTSKEAQEILQKALTHMTMTYPGFLGEINKETMERFPMTEIRSVIKDSNRVGSLSFTVSMLKNTHTNLKDLLTLESSKLFDRLDRNWQLFLGRKKESTLYIANDVEQFLIYIMAYKELVKESIFKEQGLTLYVIGYKIESALLLISVMRSVVCMKVDKYIEYDLLESLLKTQESFNAYRAYYKSSLTLENVLDFLVLHSQFPKSLSYMISELLAAFKELPKAKEYVTSYEKPMLEAQGLLKDVSMKTLLETQEEDGVYVDLDTLFGDLSALFLKCSDEFSHTYFSHYDE